MFYTVCEEERVRPGDNAARIVRISRPTAAYLNNLSEAKLDSVKRISVEKMHGE
jgi:hypothetical protein